MTEVFIAALAGAFWACLIWGAWRMVLYLKGRR